MSRTAFLSKNPGWQVSFDAVAEMAEVAIVGR
jgi:hypothetical protein